MCVCDTYVLTACRYQRPYMVKAYILMTAYLLRVDIPPYFDKDVKVTPRHPRWTPTDSLQYILQRIHVLIEAAAWPSGV